MFYEDITAFMELIQKQRFDEAEKDMKRKRREVEQARKRIAELDRIFKRIYEDDINGTISHERFLKLSAEYETEQKELTEKVNAEQQEVDSTKHKTLPIFGRVFCFIRISASAAYHNGIAVCQNLLLTYAENVIDYK